MKIAIYSDNFFPELGGIQDSIESLAGELAKRGHQITFYAPKYSQANYDIANISHKELNLSDKIKIVRFSSINFPSPTGQSRLVLVSPFRWLSLRKSRPDIIHTQTFYGVGLEALLGAKLVSIPIVGTNHMALKAFASYLPFNVKWFVRYVMWYYNHCDFITAPSQSVFDDIGEKYFKKNHQPLSNPIDTETYKPVTVERKQILKTELGVGSMTIAYAGRLGREKNVDVLIEAVALVKEKIPTVQLVIAGHGSEETALKKLAQKLNISENVKFVGTLNKTALSKMFQAANVFVTMSTSETQSMVLLQAMACGIPVIGANSLALPEYIHENNGFLIEPGNIHELANKITYILENPKIQSELGMNAAVYIEQFSIPNIATQWEKIYKAVIEAKFKANS